MPNGCRQARDGGEEGSTPPSLRIKGREDTALLPFYISALVLETNAQVWLHAPSRRQKACSLFFDALVFRLLCACVVFCTSRVVFN